VQKFGGILSNIDSEACRERRITVLSLPRQGNILVAEQALCADDRLGQGDHPLQRHRHRGGFEPPVIRCSYDRRYTGGSNYARIPALRESPAPRFGIVGLGEIGREIAIRANAFGMSLVYHQRTRLPGNDELALARVSCPGRADGELGLHRACSCR
jgi:lactate dehydrogenase-like 2-hydroxyacid dehydrogenase